MYKDSLVYARLLESAGIPPFSCQERRGDVSPGWRQARPTAVGWAGGWGCAVVVVGWFLNVLVNY